MKSIIHALQEGRLIELPESDKDKCLEYLALMIEAIPDIQTDMDIVAAVKDREAQSNTAIGRGVACPHVRVRQEGELFCALGWSPQGVDYGAPDKEKVHLIVMYYIPEAQKGAYLKEVSALAQALSSTDEIKALTQIADLSSLRSKLLDWVELSLTAAAPATVARMIKLEEKTAAMEGLKAGAKIKALSFFLAKSEDDQLLVLCQDQSLRETLEKNQSALLGLLSNQEMALAGYQVVVLSTKNFNVNRSLLECVAIQLS